jgi:hypothetical protein
MPGRRECPKADPYFPKVCGDFVRHIMLEANFFTPSQWRRAKDAWNSRETPIPPYTALAGLGRSGATFRPWPIHLQLRRSDMTIVTAHPRICSSSIGAAWTALDTTMPPRWGLRRFGLDSCTINMSLLWSWPSRPNGKVSDGSGHLTPESVHGCRPPPFAQPKCWTALPFGLSVPNPVHEPPKPLRSRGRELRVGSSRIGVNASILQQ